MDSTYVWLSVGGMALVTFLPRYLPLQLLASRRLPDNLIVWLRFVPGCIMAAMLLQWLFFVDGGGSPTALQRQYWAISLPVALLAYTSRNFLATIVCGSALAAMCRAVLPL